MGISTDIALWCQRLWDSILAISTDIALWCQRLWDSILELPNVIAEGIKDIFVPDSGYIDEAYSAFVEELKFKFNLDTTVFESLFDNETPVQDQYVEYSIFGLGNVKFKALDTEFLRDGVSYFRPFIRGFLVLLMFLFHVKQLIGFFGYNSGVVDGRTEHIKEAKK